MSVFLLLAHYVPNVAKRSILDQCKKKYIMRTDRLTTHRPTNLSFGKGSSDPLHVSFYGGVFGIGRSNGAFSGLAQFIRYVGKNNVRGVIRSITI